jgi:hypothetical protein
MEECNMTKRIISAALALLLLASSLSSCSMKGIGSHTPTADEYALFDENGNMLCDYYLINVYINDYVQNPDGGYLYLLHKYRALANIRGKDLVACDDTVEIRNSATAIYTSYGANTKSISFEDYGTPSGYAEALKLVPRSELKNSRGNDSDDSRYFCAEVIKKEERSVLVRPLDGCPESYISSALRVSLDTSGLGISADEISEGDRIRIFYDSGIFDEGINIRGVDHFELLQTEESGSKVSFLGITSYKETPVFENAVNGNEFTNGIDPGILPLHIFSSAEELRENLKGIDNGNYNFTSNASYLTDNYSDEYFDDKALIVAYLPSPSVSFQYDIKKLDISKEKITLNIIQINSSDNPYGLTMLYAVCIEVDAKTAISLKSFDITLIK